VTPSESLLLASNGAPAPAIKAVLFDKDGTLLDFNATWIPAYSAGAELVAGLAGGAAGAAHLLEAGGFRAQSRSFAAHSPLATGSGAEIAALWARLAGIDDLAGLTAALDRLFTELAGDGAVALTDLAELFGALRARGLGIGVATMDSTASARAALAALEVDHLVDFIAGYDSGLGAKPGPGMALAFCASLKHACLYVRCIDLSEDGGGCVYIGIGYCLEVYFIGAAR